MKSVCGNFMPETAGSLPQSYSEYPLKKFVCVFFCMYVCLRRRSAKMGLLRHSPAVTEFLHPAPYYGAGHMT